MDVIQASLFIPLLIVAVTQLVKMAFPQISGWLTVVIALVIGIVVALVDTKIGVQDITVAQGIVSALGAIGITTIFSKAGGGAPGDNTTPPVR